MDNYSSVPIGLFRISEMWMEEGIYSKMFMQKGKLEMYCLMQL